MKAEGYSGGEAGLKAQETDTAERLVIEAAQQDPARFAELYENHFARVYAYIARRVRDRHEAEDLTSEVFHQALASLPRFEWRGVPFAAWLFKIAANSIIDRSKRAAKEREILPGTDFPAEEVNVEEIDQRARLFQLVDRLPEDQRLVIVKRFADDKSIREIAQELGRSEGAVKQLQFRALQNLRTRERGRSGRRPGKQTGNTNG
ncbi:MAG: sigma-70 family RNA polymerase sigma factor [Acidobacteriota bacterium]